MEQEKEEIWKPVAENPNYLVSNLGRVMSNQGRKSVIMKPQIRVVKKTGLKYLSVNIKTGLYKAPRNIATLVGRAFLPPNEYGINSITYIDGDRMNINLENLRWVNYEDMSKLGKESARKRKLNKQ